MTEPVSDINHDEPLATAMLDALKSAGKKSLGAPQLARLIMPVGDAHTLLGAIRKTAIRLAHEKRLVIYRKGKPADPDDFKGIYRLGLPG